MPAEKSPPSLQTLALLHVAEHEQGAAGGVLGAAQAVATMLVLIVSTVLYGMHPTPLQAACSYCGKCG
jgi:hypothetical protein